jgi:hypothetical protein
MTKLYAINEVPESGPLKELVSSRAIVCCAPGRAEALRFDPRVAGRGLTADVWRSEALCARLRDFAAAACPDDFEAAFRLWCELSREVVRWAGFRRWASDYRHRFEAAALSALAALDVDAFFARHPLDPAPLTMFEPAHA